MRIDRQRFLLIATSMAACKGGGHLAPERVVVAEPAEAETAGASEPLASPGVDVPSDVGEAPDPQAALESMQSRCRELEAPGPVCEGIEETRQVCAQLPDALEMDAAERAVDCLATASGTTRICGYDTPEACFFEATARSLAEPRARKPCSEVMKRCSASRWASEELSEKACQRALSAVRRSLEPAMIACMQEGCGIRRCVYDLVDR